MPCFDASIRRAIELRSLGYTTAAIAQMIFATCGSIEQAHLVARAAKVFVSARKARTGVVQFGRVRWLS